MTRPNVIRAEAILAGVTITELAATVGVSRQVLYRVAQGRAEPWPKLRRDLAEALGLPESRLFPAPRITDRFVS